MASTNTQKKNARVASNGRGGTSGRRNPSAKNSVSGAKRRTSAGSGKGASRRGIKNIAHESGPVLNAAPPEEQKPAVRKRRGSILFSQKTVGLGMAVLALCALFGAFGSSGSVLAWLDTLLKGLFGYGCWLSVPVFAFCACVLLRRPDKPARDRVAAALGLMPALGILGHILLCRQSFPDVGVISRNFFKTGSNFLYGRYGNTRCYC